MCCFIAFFTPCAVVMEVKSSDLDQKVLVLVFVFKTQAISVSISTGKVGILTWRLTHF